MDCLNNIRTLEEHGIRFIAVTQGLDTDQRNPASRFLLATSWGRPRSLKRSLIRERTLAGRTRYQQDYESGKVAKTVNSRSGRNPPPHRPKKMFVREQVELLRRQGHSYRQIARRLDLGLGTVSRALRGRSNSL